MRSGRAAVAVLLVLMIGLVLPSGALAAPPVATDDPVMVDEDSGATTIDVLDNDSDDDLDALTIDGFINAAHGRVEVAEDQLTLTYEPDADFNGTDEFDYIVTDGSDTDVATVTVTVDPVNDDPDANGESRTVLEDTTTALTVLANDHDADLDTLTIIDATDGAKGTATPVDGGSKVEYDPDPNATGTNSITYTVGDGHGGEDSATVSITITAVNDAPHAGGDSSTLDEDAGPTAIDVLDNDTDVDDPDDSLVVVAVTQGARGSVAFTAAGVTYIPDLDQHGTDTFTYTVSDGDDTDVGTVTITITSKNDPPEVEDDSYAIDEDASSLFDVRSNDDDVDGDSLTITDVSDPAKGGASVESGKVRYDPDRDTHGADSFTYTVSDGHGGTGTATVSVTVTSINDDPVADGDDFPVAEDASATELPVLAGDTDPDGDTLLIVSKTNGTKGTVAIIPGGTGLTYDPFTNQTGADSFTYTISDGHGSEDTATVTVTIGGSNDKPNAVNDPGMAVPQGAGATALDVLDNDEDLDGDDLTISAVTQGDHGTVTVTGSGTGLTYNPAGNFKGTDDFTYTVTDGSLTDRATVVVTVVPDTDDPVVVAPAQRFIGQTVGSSTTKVRVSWSATDAGVGVASYKLQVSTNGGSYKTISLAKKTSTSIDRTLTTGKHYRFRVRATDKEGNVSSYRYGPTMTPARYSQESGTVTYVGTWTKTTPSKALGGSARNATSTTKSATFSFTGSDVGWITTRTTSSGKAQVLIDGAPVSIIDLDTKSTAFRKLVFQRHFGAVEPHTITITPIGDGRVDIDGFVVLK